ncbi:MAG: TrkH family potassium uptake protein [Betaproteobacteria bacterium]|jgi:trk system potassium uptake protein TrkH|nr:TrkH family potassium uptake protein [Betaproteobacteria bacterium]MBK7082807.1 TrkH family potassium uptake protein [Betaproteobacteria bacterium]MBK7745405.1 TrkH family potassium uptake protein [Betaproteobacteria bacterium]MBK8690352.1 TrkH family potassium uptake protein [Betaproteobacteria bacterium]MBK9677092.1 TrkH family potassium uptake protein [Betaproteobacteria bacterium]
MRHYFPVFAMLGGVLMLFALTMLVPLGFAWLGQDPALFAYDEAIVVTFAAGALLFFSCRRERRELQPRDGFLLVSLVWAVLPAFGMLPLIFFLPELSVTDAYFEAVSGLTTTGATTLTGLDQLPTSINVWRCFMVLMGGMGILVLAVAILPLLGVGGKQLFKAETPGPMKDEKLTPRIASTARGLWTVYFVIALACMLAYRWAGMGWADAFMHMCSTMGLGGFAAYDASFAAFASPAIEAVAVCFMLLSGLNFALYFLAWKQRSPRALWHDAEARAYVVLMSGSVAVVTAFLLAKGVYPDFPTALRYAAFNVVSVATTTGFATTDYAQWPVFAPIFMLLLCGFATCAGSTGGGVKLVRFLLLLKQARRELKRALHPRSILPVRLGHGIVANEVLFAVLAFMLVYGVVLIGATMLLLLSGLDFISGFSAAVACINNTGPGLGQVGPAGNYQGLSDFQIWVLSATMLLGRLELFSILVLFTPGFWRD